MVYDEFIAGNRGLLRHPATARSRRYRQAAPGTDASAIHGRLGAQVALLQSPILPAANLSYFRKTRLASIPVDKPHTCYLCHLWLNSYCPLNLQNRADLCRLC